MSFDPRSGLYQGKNDVDHDLSMLINDQLEGIGAMSDSLKVYGFSGITGSACESNGGTDAQSVEQLSSDECAAEKQARRQVWHEEEEILDRILLQ